MGAFYIKIGDEVARLCVFTDEGESYCQKSLMAS
jgi:hypothetical protein